MEENQILDNLADFQVEEEFIITPVDTGTRFINLIIDRIILYIIDIGVMLALELVSDSALFNFFIGAITTVTYYTILEGATNGKSIGKYLTNTRAIRNDCGDVTFHEAFSRSLSRIVPLDGFSFLFASDNRGWHDQWTNTSVIKEADYQLIKRQY